MDQAKDETRQRGIPHPDKSKEFSNHVLTSRNELPNWQPSTSPTHQPPSAKKAKNDLANKRTREQVAHGASSSFVDDGTNNLDEGTNSTNQRRTTTFCININALADPMTCENYITKLQRDEDCQIEEVIVEAGFGTTRCIQYRCLDTSYSRCSFPSHFSCSYTFLTQYKDKFN